VPEIAVTMKIPSKIAEISLDTIKLHVARVGVKAYRSARQPPEALVPG